MDRRKKLSEEQVIAVQRLLSDGVKIETVARQFSISSSHVHRIKSAQEKGEVRLKRSSLNNCLDHIENGLPFRRVAWPEAIYYYYAIDEPRPWFIQLNTETGCELITYSLDLNLEDLKAKDWVVLTWESVNNHVVDANKKVV